LRTQNTASCCGRTIHASDPARRTGFASPARLHDLLKWEGGANFSPAARDYFSTDGNPKPAGTLMQNAAYAVTLKALAANGSKAFYEGPIAQEIVAAVEAAPIAKGDLTLTDLSGYQAKERPAVCFAYRVNKICGMGPPSSGGLTVAQTIS
jgi:gamma-glutamyltranspeptidase/glutathione hydrolase